MCPEPRKTLPLHAHGLAAYVAVRPVHDAQQVSGLRRIARQAQIGEEIPCNPVFAEIRQHLPHAKGNVLAVKPPRQETRLQIGAVKDRDAVIARPLLCERAYLPHQIIRLRLRGRADHRVHRLSRGAGGSDFLREARLVPRNQSARRLHDFRGRAIVHVQYDLGGLRVVLRKIQHELRRGPAETVDGLIVVADNHEIGLLPGDHAHNLVLQAVDVLKLIDQEPVVARREGRADIRPLFEQLIAHAEHVLIIDLSEFGERVLILAINLTKLLGGTAHGIVIREFRPLLLDQCNLGEHVLNQASKVSALRLAPPKRRGNQCSSLLLADHLIRLIAVGRSQNAEKEGMKGSEANACALAPHGFSVALFHFPRRRARKGENQNGLRPRAALLREIAHALRQHKGLSGSGARNDKKRSLPVGDRFSLRRI